MEKLSSREIRDKFLEFFKKNEHMQIVNASIVPKNDPTLLFINSGMAPIKDYFTGAEKPPCKRLCNVQPCIRTIDIESIGDKHHLTSFQMLGSWSIGDYFKEKAIYFAYTLLTQYIKIPKEKLYVSVFSGDEEINLPFDQEAYDCWLKVGVPENHIVKCGKEDNFWGPTSETGPCGPCTEIFYDTGDGEEYVPGKEFDTKKRYIEIWNAGVFMQFSKSEDGTYSKLAFNSVDTGAGLERLSMVLGGYNSVYETDLLWPIKEKIESELKGKNIIEKEKLILTDHLRTICLILSEKVTPSNESRGYTPRKLIRRCMMIISKNKAEDFSFISVIDFILEKYKDMFPLFEKNHNFILSEFEKEYKQFSKVLKNGLEKLESIQEKNISAKECFELVTTYGLPFDIIKQYADEKNIQLDEKGFESEIKLHKEKSKNSSSSENENSLKRILELASGTNPTVFTGYKEYSCESEILKIIKDSTFVDSAKLGESIGIILNKTCFYAQSGGQIADTGEIIGENFKLKVKDVKKTSDGVFIHFCNLEEGTLKISEKVNAQIDFERRRKIECNHSATHLLHSALRKVYGNIVHQAGSKVESEKLRFDFNYENAISEEDIEKIEQIVNLYIRENIERKTEIKSLSEAVSSGAMALFESKYKDEVRVVSFEKISKELCGGTHTQRTGNIGLFVIIGVEGIGKGVKRITAVTGEEAIKYVQNKIKDINSIAKLYKVKPENLKDKMLKEMKNKNSKSEVVQNLNFSDIKYLNEKDKLGYIYVSEGGKKMSSEAIKLAEKLQGVLLVICGEEKKQVIVAISDKVQTKFLANEIIEKLMSLTNGKGGGNKKFATGGTTALKNDILKSFEKICLNI